MKNIKYFFIAACFITAFSSYAQTINWASLRTEQKHIANINISADYALTYGVGYAYQLKSRLPVVLNTEYSFPSGNNISDDFKTKIGGQVNLFQTGNFRFSSKVQGVFRRHETSYARLLNFGSDISGTVGYYKSKWFVAGELGFDKAIVTHFKHSDLFRENYPGVKDGWYEPSTGGNFYYGMQAGYSKSRFDIYLKAGKLVEQDFKTEPLLPFYAQLGINLRLR